RVFSDLVGVDDELVSAYGRAIEATIERLGLRDLDVFHLEHLFEVTDYDGMRDHLAVHYGEPLAELRERCREGAPAAMLNGIHRFLFEDTLGVDVDKSRNQIRKECRERAYRAIHRSNAFSRLIAECFPRALRLSIHPQPPHAAKIGILLGHAAECWITPWHGVALRTPEGWTLVKRSEAEATGARLVEREGRPSHFVLGVDEAHAISAPAAPPGPDDWRRLYAHWFGAIEDSQAWIDTRLPIWFFADPAADEVIRREFAPWLESMTPAIAEAWKAHPHGLLSLVLLYDQVPRNAFRGTARMFAWDREARALAREALDRNLHVDLSAIEAFWLFLPSQHHPALPAQRISVEGVDAQAARCLAGHRRFFGVARDMAARHDDAIRRFGRFPHRNALLGRRSTPAEVDFLQDPKNHF
ncbi:MAG: DUF924 family protein, partial [Myxococcales bacterium]|nr:DUF924 family protein [Myxococcales bacterium]